MPKLHALLIHTEEIFEWLGTLGALAEQSFEHFQRHSLEQRRVHSQNNCAGVQIFEDVIYVWLRGSPDKAEQLRLLQENRAQEKCIKRRRFS